MLGITGRLAIHRKIREVVLPKNYVGKAKDFTKFR